MTLIIIIYLYLHLPFNIPTPIINNTFNMRKNLKNIEAQLFFN